MWSWFAKVRYLESIGSDMSEMPVAGMRQRERERLLRRRIGDDEADKFMASHSPVLEIAAIITSPVFWFVTIIGVGFFLMLAGSRLWR